MSIENRGELSPEQVAEEQQEGHKEIIKRESDVYFESMRQRTNPETGTAAMVVEGAQDSYRHYQQLIAEGDYFNRRDGEKSPYDFFQGALKKYEHFQREFAEERAELSRDYERRSEQVRNILRAMEQDVGYSDFISRQDGDATEKIG